MTESILIFGRQKYSTTRYRGFRVTKPEQQIVIFFDSPREVVTIDGQENISAAIAEIELAFDPANDPDEEAMWTPLL